MRSCDRPSNNSTSVFFPSSVSKTYSFSTGTQGSSCRCFATSSSRLPTSCSRPSSSLRAADHSSCIPTLCFGITFASINGVVRCRPVEGLKLIGRPQPDDLSLPARAPGGFEHLERSDCLAGIDRRRGVLAPARDHTLIERPVVSRFGRDFSNRLVCTQTTPVLPGLLAPAGLGRVAAGLEGLFLDVKPMLRVGGVRAEDAETQAALRRDGAHPQMGDHARRVFECNEDVVVDLRAGATDPELGVDSLRWAEELEGLVHEMAAEIEQETACLLGRR